MIIPDKISIKDKYAPAMEITEQKEADEYFAACVEHNLRTGGKTREAAEIIERANLGYFAGYYDNETRARVEKLFQCAHPIFGSIADNGFVTVEEAYRKGFEMGRVTERFES